MHWSPRQPLQVNPHSQQQQQDYQSTRQPHQLLSSAHWRIPSTTNKNTAITRTECTSPTTKTYYFSDIISTTQRPSKNKTITKTSTHCRSQVQEITTTTNITQLQHTQQQDHAIHYNYIYLQPHPKQQLQESERERETGKERVCCRKKRQKRVRERGMVL